MSDGPSGAVHSGSAASSGVAKQKSRGVKSELAKLQSAVSVDAPAPAANDVVRGRRHTGEAVPRWRREGRPFSVVSRIGGGWLAKETL